MTKNKTPERRDVLISKRVFRIHWTFMIHPKNDGTEGAGACLRVIVQRAGVSSHGDRMKHSEDHM